MNPGQTSSASTPETSSTEPPHEPPRHTGVCSVCGAEQVFDSTTPLVAHLQAFAAEHAHESS